MTDGIRGSDRFRWWYWRPEGLAHARRTGSRGRAVCGASIHAKACYPLDQWPSCEACAALVDAAVAP